MNDVRNIVDELRGEYVEHGLQQADLIAAALDRLQAPGGDADAVREIHRQVHSIKGTAYSFGLAEVSLFAAAWEADILAAMEGDASARVSGWRGLCHALRTLFAIAHGEAPATGPTVAPWKSALIWTPYESGRRPLATLAEKHGASAHAARTDREAVSILARGGIDTIVSDTVTDAELDFEQRARLLGAVAAGMGAGWVIAAGASDGEDDADSAGHLATAIRYGAQPA